jgi:hypothetical protein
MLYEDSAVKISQVSDGTTNTLLIGERGVPDAHDNGWMTGPGLADACPGGWTDVVLPVQDNMGRSGLGEPQTDEQRSYWWWSQHAGGVNFTLLDMTVRFVNSNIDPDVLAALCTRADGDKVPSDW